LKDHRKVVAWLASFVCVVSVGCAVLGLVFLYLNGNFASILEEEGVDAVAAAAFPTVGATIAARRPGNPIGWIFCLTGLSLGVAIFASGYAEYALVTQPDALPAGILAAWLGTWTWLPGIVLGPTFLLLLFPHGRLPSRRWRPVPWFSVGATALGVGVLMVLPWSSLDISLPAENPFEIADAQTIEFAAFAVGIGAGMVSMALSVLALILRFRRSRGVERQQLKWFVYAGTLTVVLLFLPLFPAFGVVGSFLQVLAAPLLPAAAGVAILRHRLYDIDVLVNRTLVYGALTATLALVYLGGVATTQTVFRFLTEQDQQPQLAVVASTLLIAALFNPLRRRIQSFIDRRFYRSKYDARKTLEDFSTRLREETDLDGLTAELLEVTRQTMQPARVSLWLRRPTSDREPDVDSR
jgi:multisubunit Na+/H+ antiporter MnhB subunit